MPKKLTISVARKIAKKHGGKLLSKQYLRNSKKLKWECSLGHSWFATLNSVKDRGRWCPACGHRSAAIKRRVGIAKIRRLARMRGGKCLSEEYTNNKDGLLWQCKFGHKWIAPYNQVQGGTWCPFCAGKRVTIEDLKKVAQERGGKCLSKRYERSHRNLTWRCKFNHIWKATPRAVKRGTWCPICAGNVKRTVRDAKKLAIKYGGSCLSEKYINNKVPMLWRCRRGHTWKASYHEVQTGNWCWLCGKISLGNKMRKYTVADVQKIAKARGGKLLSKSYKSFHKKLKWRCELGHEWEATLAHIKFGERWCPVCSQGISERICRSHFEHIFKKKFPKQRPEWLRNSIGKLLELDGYCQELGLAFEYSGAQHYIRRHYRGTRKEFFKLQADDKRKKQLCRKNGVTLIEVPYTVGLDSLYDYIVKECRKRGISVPRFKKVDYHKFDIYVPKRLEEAKEIASQRGGECLSKKFINNKTKLAWRCAEGHAWNAELSGIKAGKWCPICGGSKKLTIEEMREIAERQGGRCLSSKYVNNKTKLKWQCKKKHKWMAAPGSVRSGQWCRKCWLKKLGEQMRGTIEDMNKIAAQHGGKCLSRKYIDSITKLRWQCKESHTWKARPASIKSGEWCPKCGRKRVADKQRGTIEDMRKLAAKRGGKCLSKKYVSALSKLRWRCKEGHTWKAKPGDIKFGTWCPRCARSKKKQKGFIKVGFR